MNTTEMNLNAPKAPSAAESQLLQSSLLLMAQAHGENASHGPPALSATPTLSGLIHALRRRWMLAFGVATAATVATVIAVFVFMPAKYNVNMRERVVAKQASAEDVEFPIFKANMEAMVRHPLVISNALNDKTADGRDIKDLPLVKSKGMAVNDWLEKQLKTDYLLGPEVLRVTLAADQPEEAADLLNAIGKAFLNEYNQMELSKKQLRLAELRKQKEKTEDELRQYRANLVQQLDRISLKDRDAMMVQQQQLLARLTGAEATRRATSDDFAKAQSRIFTSKARLNSLDKQPIPDVVLYELYSKDASILAFDKMIVEIDEKIVLYQGKYNEPYLSRLIGPLKQDRFKIRMQKTEREEAMKPALEERWRVNMRAELEFQISAAELDKQDAELRMKTVAAEVQDLERKVKESGPGANRPAQILAIEEKIEGAKKALEFTGQKISDVELEVPLARIIPIQQAAPPLERDRAQQTKIAGAGGLGIFMLALFGVAFFEFRLRKISSADDVERGLGVKVVGTIPAMPARSKKSGSGDAAAEQKWLAQLNESVDAIRTVLLHRARTEALHVIMVTSAQSGEGKTTLATQLAASLSRGWKRVLVIDGDLRHPAAHTLFDTPQEPGFAEVLRGEVEPADAVRATSLSRLWVLPAGNGDAHAIQALAQDNVRTLLEQLKQQYDFIIIDTPPVLPVTDTLLLGQHVDGVLFAILSDVSRAPAVYAAQQKLLPLEVTPLGAVVLGTQAEFGEKTYGYAN